MNNQGRLTRQIFGANCSSQVICIIPIYYVSLANELMAVDVEREGDTLEVGIPHRLFPLASDPTFLQRNPFDVTADGQRFLVNALAEDSASTSITWVLNWTADLEP